MLAPMLLNDVQKQNAELHSQQEENRRLEEQNRKLEDRLAALEALFSGQTATPTSSR
jgi:cell division protein FtsB